MCKHILQSSAKMIAHMSHFGGKEVHIVIRMVYVIQFNQQFYQMTQGIFGVPGFSPPPPLGRATNITYNKSILILYLRIHVIPLLIANGSPGTVNKNLQESTIIILIIHVIIHQS